MKALARLAALALVLLLGTAAQAGELTDLPRDEPLPIRVAIAIRVIDISQVQETAGLMAARVELTYRWQDRRLAFDRVREVFIASRKRTSSEMIDSAVNETLSRTVMTSGATMIVVAALFLFGGEALKGFSSAILVGIVIGTYSSIFVAGALALDMKLKPTDLMPPVRDDKELDAIP